MVVKLNPMLLHAQPLLFEFEIASSENLTYIPMCVRFNLDRCAFRLTLTQWQALPHAGRERLACYPLTGSGSAADGFVRDLAELLAVAGAGALAALTDAPDAAWANPGQVPAALAQQAALHQLAPLSLAEWARLPEFQRYVLVKLSRRPTANHDFLAALQEFGRQQGPGAPFIGDHH